MSIQNVYLNKAEAHIHDNESFPQTNSFKCQINTLHTKNHVLCFLHDHNLLKVPTENPLLLLNCSVTVKPYVETITDINVKIESLEIFENRNRTNKETL